MTQEFVVSVVDNDPHIRDALRAPLESAGFEVRDFASAERFLAADVPGRSCLIVGVPGMDGLRLLAEIARRGIDLPVIVMTDPADVALAVRAMKVGAVDFLERPISGEALLASIGHAIAYACRKGFRAADIIAARNTIMQLRYRERRVLHVLAAGESNKTAAVALGMSEEAVEDYRSRIMKKIGAQSLSDLVRVSLLAARACPSADDH